MSASFVYDRAMLSRWDSLYGDWLFCPLRIQAWDVANRNLPDNRILELSDLISPDERNRVYSEISEARRTVDLRGRESGAPSIRMAQNGWPQILFNFGFWRRILIAIEERYLNVDVLYLDPFGEGYLGSSLRCSLHILESLVHERFVAKPPRSFVLRMLKSLGIHMGRAVNIAHHALMKDAQFDENFGNPEICYLGLHVADIRLRARFLIELRRVLAQRLVIVHRDHERIALIPDERADTDELSALIRSDGVYFVKDLPQAKWRRKFLGRLSSMALRSEFAMLLVKYGGYSQRDAEMLSNIIISPLGSQLELWKGIQALMNRLSPRLIVASSMLGPMYAVRDYARDHEIPYVQYPHGVFVDSDHSWDADIVIALGECECEWMEAHYPQPGRRVLVGGSYLHAQLGKLGWRWSASDSSSNSCMCYLSSGEADIQPSIVEEYVRDLSSITSELGIRGGAFVVRLHPRLPPCEPLREAINVCKDNGLELSISKCASLVDDFRRCRCVIAQTWSGALLQALYLGVPVIIWEPRGVHDPWSRNVFSGIPLHAQSGNEVAIIFEKLASIEYADTITAKQEALLENYMADPRGNPSELVPRVAGTWVEALTNKNKHV